MAAADQPPHEHPGRRRGDGDGDGDDEAADHPARAVIGRRRRRGGGGIPRQQLLDSGRHFMLLGALVLTWHHHLAGAGHVLAAFFALWLLGAALAMLALVARRFPRLASAAAALATALRRYLLGGL